MTHDDDAIISMRLDEPYESSNCIETAIYFLSIRFVDTFSGGSRRRLCTAPGRAAYWTWEAACSRKPRRTCWGSSAAEWSGRDRSTATGHSLCPYKLSAGWPLWVVYGWHATPSCSWECLRSSTTAALSWGASAKGSSYRCSCSSDGRMPRQSARLSNSWSTSKCSPKCSLSRRRNELVQGSRQFAPGKTSTRCTQSRSRPYSKLRLRLMIIWHLFQ